MGDESKEAREVACDIVREFSNINAFTRALPEGCKMMLEERIAGALRKRDARVIKNHKWKDHEALRTQRLLAEDKLAAAEQRANQLTDTLDLMRDEFKRILAIRQEINSITRWDEIAGICERAMFSIVQIVPVIVQRDKSEQRCRELQDRVDVAESRCRELEAEIKRVVEVWERQVGRVMESMGGDNPRLLEIDAAVEAARKSLQKEVGK